MSNQILDQQFENLFARALANPYFDLEQALCFAIESHRQQMLAVSEALPQTSHVPLSVVKIFAWPGEELCACLHKGEKDQLYIFESAQKNVVKIESTQPLLRPIEKDDRIVVLNEHVALQILTNELEQILQSFAQESDEALEKELYLRANVNARGNEHSFPSLFVVFSVRA